MTYLRWQQAEGRRHAAMISDDGAGKPRLLESFRALCGQNVTPKQGDLLDLGGKWFDPTCWDCNGAWLAMDVTATGVLRTAATR